jgi:hypothetical protein
MLRVKNELVAIGFFGEPIDFYKMLCGLLSESHPGWSDEQLKRHPRLALQFCEVVRQRTELPDLTDPLILGGLENARKKKIRPSGFSKN